MVKLCQTDACPVTFIQAGVVESSHLLLGTGGGSNNESTDPLFSLPFRDGLAIGTGFFLLKVVESLSFPMILPYIAILVQIGLVPSFLKMGLGYRIQCINLLTHWIITLLWKCDFDLFLTPRNFGFQSIEHTNKSTLGYLAFKLGGLLS